MQIYLGADYRGFERKQALKAFLAERGYNVIDLGVYNGDEQADFNEPAVAVSKEVREDFGSFGILICDSAHGMTIQANRFKGIRAANCDSVESAMLAREHDDANVLCLSAHFVDNDEACEIARVFLETKFDNLERRVRRINKIDEREDYD